MSHVEIPTTGAEPCAKADPELFFPFKGQTDLIAAAKALCFVCPVKRACRDYALNHAEELDGIWGGTTREERAALRRRQAPARVTVRRAS